MNKMEYLYTYNKNEFWKFLKSMKNQKMNEELPELNTLIEHFKNLFYQETVDKDSSITENLSHEHTKHFDILNAPIKQKEIEENLHNLKLKKSPGFDCITNEMLKCTNSKGNKLLTILFNKILKSGIFPSEWNYGMIKLINKGNDVYDPNDYRGITLNSCLGKLFCTILYNRLSPLLENKNVYCKEQAGFRQNHRTTDHIFLLRYIIKKYTSQNNILYSCFVDFSKAFDSIWRGAMIKKLHQIGINGPFLQVIKSIYHTTTNSLIYNDSLTPKFMSNIGVKQGDTLSTILFNLYINDLPNIFSFVGSDPIVVDHSSINCLIYADDLVIMSTTAEGLQNCINKLATYCDKWKLQVNLKKTKVILYNRQGSLIKKHSFLFKSNNIEITKQYKYLGFIFSCSGSTTAGVTNLINQAQKAWFSIKYYLSSSKQKNIKTYLTLFDSQIKPILLYACEAWADSIKGSIDDVSILTKNKLETFQTSIYKQLLGVSRKTTNIAVLLELGRYPISTYMHYQAIKYFSRLSSIKNERLLYESYNLEKQKFENGENGFINYITNVLNKIGMANIWIDQIEHDRNNIPEKPHITKTILTRFHDIFAQTALTHLQNTNKLTFLKSLKETYRHENYLTIKNFSNRRALTKLRVSNHTLAIEVGRWTNIERENRLCKQCTQQKIEDEIHLLFECTKYTDERKTTFETIKEISNIDLFIKENEIENLQILFNSNSLSALNALGKFIKNSLSNREG